MPAVPHDARVVRVGAPMWGHRPWVGRYLDPRHKGAELADYARWCNAVEGNTTFYAEPAAASVAKWAEQTPTDFRFAFKAPRTVTHDRRLRQEAHRDLASFLRAIEPLGERIGPIQLQLPPSFGPESGQALCEFVRRLPTSHRWVVEVRHPAFFDGGDTHRRVDEALATADVGRVVLDTRPLYARPPETDASVQERRTKPRLPVVTDVLGTEPVIRVIGCDDVDDTLGGLATWVPHVVEWLAEGRRPYVFVHQPENLRSPEIARRFHAMVTQAVPHVTELPTPPTIDAEPPTQTPLF